MKILDVTEFYSLRGGGVRGHLTSKNHVLCQLGHKQAVLAPGPTSASTDEVQFLGGPALPYDPTYHLLWRIDKIRAAVKAQHPDVLEIHSPYVAALGCLSVPRSAFGIRTFFWHSDFIDTHAPRLLRPLWAWVRQVTARCDRTIAASAYMRSKLLRHGAVRIERIPMGVDRAVFHPGVAKRRSELAREGEILLVGVGRFAFEKKWDVVIDALKILRAEGMNARLVLFGDGPERKKLDAMAGEGIELPPFEHDRARLASAVASADVFVHGCPFETFGIAIAEAVACEVPIVVPDDGGAAEQVVGASGRRYRAGDPRDCARAIRDLLEADPDKRKSAAAAAAKDVLSIEEHFGRTLALYESVLETARGRSRIDS